MTTVESGLRYFKSWMKLFSHSTSTHEKAMDPTILLLVMSKIVQQTEPFNHGMATSLGKGKLWIQTSCWSSEG